MNEADDRLSELRIAARRSELGDLARLARPLRPLASDTRSLHLEARVKKLLGITLGILTAIGGFVDIGDIVANSATGARFGMSLAWTVVLGVIGIVVFAEMSGQVAAVSKRATFDLVRERLGARTAFVNLGASFFMTMLTLIAEVMPSLPWPPLAGMPRLHCPTTVGLSPGTFPLEDARRPPFTAL